MTPKRVFLTGGAGFVATRMVEHLAGSAWQTHASSTDILDGEALQAELRQCQPDIVLHLAAQSHVPTSFREPELTARVNFDGTRSLLTALDQSGFTGALVFVGSGDMYGLVPEASLPIRETQTLRPRNPYAASKVAAEAWCMQHSLHSQYRIVMARAFNHIGRGQNAQFVLPAMAEQLVAIERGQRPPILETGDLDVTRDFTNVSDVLDAYLALAEKGVSGEVYNVCSGLEYRVRDLVAQMIVMIGLDIQLQNDPARFRKAEQTRVVGDNSKLRVDTGWAPKMDIAASLAEILDDWRRKT
ncbi:GDP-mannose 4,6-dehydratase [Rivihabitans pingtungensis]|uniref:GDP-4-dehydro-6-deoxy-D-mannose reductase n=1 Tax=Rivihabitans pingtungensis TaxID=1054498 RepID=A0A318KHV7_9NEIS|nr:GDP-mannose 4,6-dehydratase [Rivihabitans pingtungensis]PXX75077.1 GDP-4-dehydro-6-deoxy-D-mannose reductase [Rivihabitans pingtungensis]